MNENDGTNMNLMAATLDMKNPRPVKYKDGQGHVMKAYVITDEYLPIVKKYTAMRNISIGDAIIEYTETSFGFVSKKVLEEKFEEAS